MVSAAEDLLAAQLKALQIEHAREFKFSPTRRWRADFLVGDKLLVEVDGGAWVNGRHNRGAGFRRDLEKLNAAAELGYVVLRYMPEHVKSGAAVAQIERMVRPGAYRRLSAGAFA